MFTLYVFVYVQYWYSRIYLVVLCSCFSSSWVPYIVSFSGLPIFFFTALQFSLTLNQNMCLSKGQPIAPLDKQFLNAICCKLFLTGGCRGFTKQQQRIYIISLYTGFSRDGVVVKKHFSWLFVLVIHNCLTTNIDK